MNKKELKKIVKHYFEDNNRMMGIFIFIFILTNFLFLLGSKDGIGQYFGVILAGFVLVIAFLYWKVLYLTILAYSDIKNKRFIKKNITLKEIKEDKSWILWNSNPKNMAVCKYIAVDENNEQYRFCTTCNYQNIEAINKFMLNNSFRIVKLEKSKMIICIQNNPAEFNNKKESQEVAKTTKNLFGPFCYTFSYKEND